MKQNDGKAIELILFEHLELHKLKGTSTAGKMMLFCIL